MYLDLSNSMNRNLLILGGKVVGLVVLALGVTLIVHSIGGQSLLTMASFFLTVVLGIPTLSRTESKFDLSLDVDQTVESKSQNLTMNPSSSISIEWAESPQENLEKVNTNPEWRKSNKSEYETWRDFGAFLYRISNKARDRRFISENRVMSGLILTVVFGCSWFILLFIELMASSSMNPMPFALIAEIPPLNYSMEDFPAVQFIISLSLFLVPIGYLDWKRGTTCANCGTPFSLRSKGKYWHPDLKEEELEDGSRVTIYHGVRFRECENCDELFQDTNYSWKESK